jgi:hypothetical protein
MRVREGGGPIRFAVAVLACVALLAPGTAVAATVVNGDFESGTLQGWHLHRETEDGNWFAYKGVNTPISQQRGRPVAPPPQGSYAAITDEVLPDSLILYQDITLEPGFNYRLSLLAYYDSLQPIAVPTPDTLSVDPEVLGGQHNQQFRIDVIKPEAPLASVDQSDVLRTLFKTEPGRPETMEPTQLATNLSAFAGQTVRLRIANAVDEDLFNAGLDAVALESVPAGQKLPPLGRSRLTLGKAKLDRKNGTATLAVRAPGPGRLTAKAKLLRPASVTVGAGGKATIHLKPTAAAMQSLRRKHELRVKVAVIYLPKNGARETATAPVVLRLEAAPHHRR